MYGKRRLDVWCSDDERLVLNNGISPFCKRADYYYHSVMSIDAGCVGTVRNVFYSYTICLNAIDRCVAVVYNECIIFVECWDFHIPDKGGGSIR